MSLDSREIIGIASSHRTPWSVGALDRNYLAVASLDSVPVGGVLKVTVEGHTLLLVRSTADAVQACQGLCPHDKADLELAQVKDGRLVCARHLASFDLASGTASSGWDKLEPLRLYPAHIENGKVWVDLAAIRRNPPSGARKVWDFTQD